MIEELQICGFRVFPGDEMLKMKLISEGFILIGGSNARGKTSLYLSLSFVFGSTKGIFYPRRIRNVVNDDNNTDYAKVIVILKNIDKNGARIFPGFKEEHTIIERIIGKKDSDNDKITVNGDIYTASELRSMLRQAHIDPDNPYQFIPQGNLTALINKSPEDRLKLLDILIPASITGQKFLQGLRQIRGANITLQALEKQGNKLERDEMTALKIRQKYEERIDLSKKIKETTQLKAYVDSQDLFYIKKEAETKYNESMRRIDSFSDRKKQLKKDILEKEILKTQKEEVEKRIDQKTETLQEQKEKKNQELSQLRYQNSRILSLEKKLESFKPLDLEQSKISRNDIHIDLTDKEREFEAISSEIKEQEATIKLLDKEINHPKKVKKALDIAKKIDVKAIYTFDKIEWQTTNSEDKIRLELLFQPIKESITVSSFEDAQKIISNYNDIPVLVAFKIDERCDHLDIKGILAEERSSLLNAIENEWGSLQDSFVNQYNRQILKSGVIYNITSITQHDSENFIGKIAILKKKEREIKILKKLEEKKASIFDEIKLIKLNLETAEFNVGIAGDFNELRELRLKNLNFQGKLDSISQEIQNFDLTIGKNLNLSKDIHAVIAVLQSEVNKIEDELQKFIRGIEGDKKAVLILKKEFDAASEIYINFYEEHRHLIEEGLLIAEKMENVGTSGAFQGDIENWQRRIDQIGEIPDNAIEAHDRIRKNLERFRKNLEQQKSVANIDPAKVKEDIVLYEKAIHNYIKSINVHFNEVMNELGGTAQLVFNSMGLDELNWEYKAGLKIFAQFHGKAKVEVEEHCSLSGGEKTRLIMSLIVALIRSQEEQFSMPFLVLDEFDAQLDKSGHRKIMEILKRDIGVKQLLIMSPNRLKDKAIIADQFFAFTNKQEDRPEIKIIAVKEKNTEI